MAPLPNGPRGLPLIGVGAAWLRDPLAFVGRTRREWGSISRFHLGSERVWLVSDGPCAREILGLSAQKVAKGPSLKRARRLLGGGLLVSEGELHTRRRKAVRPVLSRGAVARQCAAAPEIVSVLHATWEDGAMLEIQPVMTRLVLDLTARNLLGACLDRNEIETLTTSMDVLLARFWLSLLPGSEAMEWMPVGPLARVLAAQDAIDAVVRGAIARTRAGDVGGGALDDLAAALDDDAVRDEVINLLLAGAETTASMLAWTWVLLSTHPAVQARVQAEVDQLPGSPTPADRLPVVASVLDEALRLYPPVWLTTRRLLCPYKLQDHRLEPGDLVMIDLHGIMRDPEVFADPDAFRPDRWRSDSPSPAVAMSFGAGPRRCPGDSMARIMGAIVVAEIARHWTLEPAGAVQPRATVTLQPHRARLRLRAR